MFFCIAQFGVCLVLFWGVLLHTEPQWISGTGLVYIRKFMYTNPLKTNLVGGWTNPSEKYDRQKWVHLPQIGGEIFKNIWNHHLVTAKAPENWPGPKRKIVVFQPSIFRGKLAVSLRQGMHMFPRLPVVNEGKKKGPCLTKNVCRHPGVTTGILGGVATHP